MKKILLALILAPFALVASWSEPVDLTTTGQNASGSQVVINSNGDGVAVWSTFDGTNTIVQAAFFTSGSWGSPEQISTANTDAYDVVVGTDNSGNVIVAWDEFNGTVTVIKVNVYTAGSGWQGPTLISDGVTDSFQPDISVNGTGDALVIWNENGEFFYVVQGIDYTGGVWGEIQTISPTTEGAESYHVKLSDSGFGAAIWIANNNSGTLIHSSTYESGTWTEQDLTTTGDSFDPHISLDSTNNGMAVWITGTLTGWAVQEKQLVNGTWDVLPTAISLIGNNPTEPRIAFNSNNKAVAIWNEYDASTSLRSLQSSHFDGTAILPAWSTPEQISTTGQATNTLPRLSLNDSDHAIAVWTEYNGTKYFIMSSLFTFTGGTWTQTPLSDDGEDAMEPALDFNASGEALATWERFDGSNWIIQSSTGP